VGKLLAFTLVVVFCVACGSQTQVGGPRVPGAGAKFAGYVWQGDLTSVGANWVVPAIRHGSQIGKASTWIGAVAPSAGQNSPFIQVGTQEELLRSSVTTTGAAPGYFYEAFWSDTRLGFHPMALFRVAPGDRITAGLRLGHKHWTVTIEDHFTGSKVSFTTRQEGTARFNQAEWTQEDVTNAKTNRAFPYPKLASVQMSSLTVDSMHPSYASLYSSWMALPHDYLGPSPLEHDAFTIEPKTLSPAGARFLRISVPFNAADISFSKQLKRWLTTSVKPSALKSQTDRFIAALSLAVTQMRAATWPRDVSVAIRRLTTRYAAQIPRLGRAATLSAAAVIAVFPYGEARRAAQATAHIISRRLGIEDVP
jgi:hypothetical protein